MDEEIERMLSALSAEGLDELIKRAALIRAQREPTITREVSHLETAIVQIDPQFAVTAAEEGRVALHIRNEGLGWLHIAFDQRRASFLRDAFSKRIAGEDLSLFKPQIPGGDTLQ